MNRVCRRGNFAIGKITTAPGCLHTRTVQTGKSITALGVPKIMKLQFDFYHGEIMQLQHAEIRAYRCQYQWWCRATESKGLLHWRGLNSDTRIVICVGSNALLRDRRDHACQNLTRADFLERDWILGQHIFDAVHPSDRI